MMILLPVAGLLLLLLSGAAVYLALGATSALAFLADGHALPGLAQLIMDRLNSGTLVAVPFFVIAATFMQKSGAAHALVEAANAWVGRFRGGLALVSVLAATLFSAISGSSTATALALGAILIPAMRSRHYPEPFAAGIVGASATLGILIPPSLVLIVYGVVADESIPQLFLAGVAPGLLLAALFMAWALLRSRQGHLPAQAATPGAWLRLQLRGLPASSIPLVALGGIYSGVLTITEAAAAAALTAVLLSLFVYNQERINVLDTLAEAMQKSAAIMMIVAFAFPFAHVIAVSGAPAQFAAWVGGLEVGPSAFMLLLSAVMLALGTILEAVSVILITLPVVLPALHELGIDPIHYAVVVIVNLGIATLTPPIGLSLFVLRSLSTASFADLVRGLAPFLALLLALLLLVIFFPQLSLWLPRAVYG